VKTTAINRSMQVSLLYVDFGGGGS
jgi:hypothetical protein